jgi:hypothetical protein
VLCRLLPLILAMPTGEGKVDVSRRLDERVAEEEDEKEGIGRCKVMKCAQGQLVVTMSARGR